MSSLPDTTTPRRGTLPALTSLRFAAAAMIVVGHAAGQFGTIGVGGMPLNQGVSFFFVLSGFILSYNYPEFRSMPQVTRFLLARLARIWPLHVACLGLFFLVLPRELWYIPYPTPTLATLLTFNLLLVQSWIPFKQVVLSLNGVAWSISVELFFYLVFPALVYFRRFWRWHLALAAALVIGTAMLVVQNDVPLEAAEGGITALTLLYNNPLARIVEFLVGMLAARAFLATRGMAVSPAVATAAELLALAGTVWLLRELPGWCAAAAAQGPYGRIAGFWALNEGAFPAFAILVVVMARGEGYVAAALAHPVATFLGEISFALYLVHQIVLRAWGAAPSSAGQAWFHYLLVWAVLLAASSILHLAVERPARRLIMAWAGPGSR